MLYSPIYSAHVKRTWPPLAYLSAGCQVLFSLLFINEMRRMPSSFGHGLPGQFLACLCLTGSVLLDEVSSTHD